MALQKAVFGVFGPPSLRSTRKRDETKKTEEKLALDFLPVCVWKCLTEFLQKNV
jgi:hypothetical protein